MRTLRFPPDVELPDGVKDWTGVIRSLTSGLTDNANVNIVRLPSEGSQEATCGPGSFLETRDASR